MQRTAGDVDGSDVGGWPELSSGAKEDDLGLVGVELQTVLQKPQADCSRGAGESVDGKSSPWPCPCPGPCRLGPCPCPCPFLLTYLLAGPVLDKSYSII